MSPNHDPMGAAIADYYRLGSAARLRVFSPDFDEDEIPLATLFRTLDEMPPLEQQALRMARGATLDVGAGAGCHSLALQSAGIDVTAIDISPLAVETMLKRGVIGARQQDFWTVTQSYDTILMLMNGIGIVGTLDALPRFFLHIGSILRPDGQLIIDSSDLRYLFTDDEGNLELPDDSSYYGELTYRMQYKSIRGESFLWLYIDFATLQQQAAAHGFRAELIRQGDHYDYLARISRS